MPQMSVRVLLCGVAVGASCAAGSPAKADVTFSDTEFASANWGFETITVGTGGTSTSAQVSGGNPGFARQITNVVNGGGTVWGLSRFGTSTTSRYDPSLSGAISSVDFTIDSQWLSGIGGQGMSIGIGAKQGSVAYYAALDITGSSGSWHTHSVTGLTAADFVAFSGGPIDFSATGAPVRFGFIVGNSSTGGGYTNVVQYDNFSVTVHSVPAPAAAATLGLGVAGAFRRRRK